MASLVSSFKTTTEQISNLIKYNQNLYLKQKIIKLKLFFDFVIAL